jgi:hypothetical protein
MKSRYLLTLFCLQFLNANAQWDGTTNFTSPVWRSGNVGIGTTSAPVEKFQIGGLWTFHDGGDKVIGYNHDFTSNSIRIIDRQAQAIRFTGDGKIRFQVAPYGTSGSTIAWTEALTVENNGKVGIGTTAPVGRFEIYTNTTGGDQLHVDNDNFAGRSEMILKEGGVTKAALQWRGTTNGAIPNSARFVTQTGTNADIILGTNGATHLFIAGGQNGLAAGHVGIGTATPSAKLHVNGQIWSSSIELRGTGTPYIDFSNDGATDYDARFILRSDDALELQGGNLLIGKSSQTNSTYKLDVGGKIRANEIVVNTDGADFVFEPTYDLPSLKEVEDFISKNKHLPGIPSASIMQEEGMLVGEINTKLLQKIEELTLYMIQQAKDNEEMKKEIQQLKKLVNEKD